MATEPGDHYRGGEQMGVGSLLEVFELRRVGVRAEGLSRRGR